MATARIAVVTGANRGLGRNVAKRLSEEGYSVIAVCRRLEDAQDAVRDGIATQPACFDAGRCISETRAAVESCTRRIVEITDGRPLDLLVNNAGVYLDGWTRADFDQAVAVNVASPILFTQALAPYFSDTGCVVNVSSGYGALDGLTSDYRARVERANTCDEILAIGFDGESPMGGEFKPTYKITKAMLNRWTRRSADSDSENLARIPHAAVCPGWCRTRMGGESATRSAFEGAASILAPAFAEDRHTYAGTISRDGDIISW